VSTGDSAAALLAGQPQGETVARGAVREPATGSRCG
jgi:hypothetical protein